MNIVLELPIKKEKLDCGPPLGVILAPYGVDLNNVVDGLNKLLEKGQIAVNSKVSIEIDLEKRTWKFVDIQKKTSEQLKALAKDGKIKHSDLEKFVVEKYKLAQKEGVDKKINELKGICKSMHLEIEK